MFLSKMKKSTTSGAGAYFLSKYRMFSVISFCQSMARFTAADGVSWMRIEFSPAIFAESSSACLCLWFHDVGMVITASRIGFFVQGPGGKKSFRGRGPEPPGAKH